jgi:hypothetical protein
MKCSKVWNAGVVEFRIKRVIKGQVRDDSGRLTLSAWENCWETARVPEAYIGREVRLFGRTPGNPVLTNAVVSTRGIVNVVLLADLQAH